MFGISKKASYENIEIIVVDRFSEDRTVEVAEEYAKIYQGRTKAKFEKM